MVVIMVIMPMTVSVTALPVMTATTVVVMGIIRNYAGTEACDESGGEHEEEGFRSHVERSWFLVRSRAWALGKLDGVLVSDIEVRGMCEPINSAARFDTRMRSRRDDDEAHHGWDARRRPFIRTSGTVF